MKIVFISNFLNHHQLSTCIEFAKNNDFTFIATMAVTEERLKLGYKDANTEHNFVLRTYENDNNVLKAKELINDADIVIASSCAFPFDWIEDRMQKDKLTFWFSERLFKHGILQMFYPPTAKRVLSQCTKYRKNANFYLLCAGGYVASDYDKYLAFPNKKLEWGYFPQLSKSSLENLIEKKEKNKKLKILWAGRFLKWKRPKFAIDAGILLKKHGIDFQIDMIGDGKEMSKIKALAEKYNLNDVINFHGSVSSDKVTDFMEEANIFLFTSNKVEGWGAVLNEAMGSACAIIAGDKIGAVKSIIKNGDNGLIFTTKNEFREKLLQLAQSNKMQLQLAKNAFKTINGDWSIERRIDTILNVKEK